MLGLLGFSPAQVCRAAAIIAQIFQVGGTCTFADPSTAPVNGEAPMGLLELRSDKGNYFRWGMSRMMYVGRQ